MHRGRLWLSLWVAIGLSGCTTMEVQRDAMLPPPAQLGGGAATKSVVVRVERTPGPRGVPGFAVPLVMWSDDEFRAAIAEAVVQSRLFDRVVADGAADFWLTVTVLNVTQPAFGFDMTVTMAADWSLAESPQGTVLGHEFVSSSCRKGISDAFSGRDRLLLTTGCAARENITEGLQRIVRMLEHRAANANRQAQ